MRNIIHFICRFLCSSSFCFFLCFCTLTASSAEENSEKKGVETATAPHNEHYEYLMDGRADPFKPFISLKATTPAGYDPNEIVEENKDLTGMQLFEPGQLTLVGVLMAEGSEVAMVEDQTKKGYFLKQGSLIGRRGVVTLIEQEQVVITETAYTRAGKEITSTVIMRLNKEGDK